jgi:N utilization substance protein A
MNDEDGIAMFMNVLDVSRGIAESLVRSQITTIEEVAYVPIDELLKIDLLNEESVTHLREKAKQHLMFRAITFGREDELE